MCNPKATGVQVDVHARGKLQPTPICLLADEIRAAVDAGVQSFLDQRREADGVDLPMDRALFSHLDSTTFLDIGLKYAVHQCMLVAFSAGFRKGLDRASEIILNTK